VFSPQLPSTFPQLRLGFGTALLEQTGPGRNLDSYSKGGPFVYDNQHRSAVLLRQTFDHSVYLSGSYTAPRVAPTRAAGLPELTRREREILQLVVEGHSNAKLAKMLWVTEHTVKVHLSNVYRKLKVSNRTEAARCAQLHGLLGDPTGRELVA